MTQQDDARSKILARRAAFVAAALAGLSVAGGCSTKPQICLSLRANDAEPLDDAGPPAQDVAPQVCLSPLLHATPPVDAAPRPCLTMVPPSDR